MPFLRNLPRCAAKAQEYFACFDESQKLRETPGYGDLYAEQHMFRHAVIDWGFCFSEPKMIQGLAHFLLRSRQSCWYFLLALFSTARENIPHEDRNTFLRSASVETETRINVGKNKSMRTDLCIRWYSANGCLNLAVVEFKFEHPITKGQLRNYRHYAEKQANATGGHYYLFLVFQKLDKKSLRLVKNHYNKIWDPIQWIPLLKCWECYLTADTEMNAKDFAQFRHTLWQRALNH
ncbi:hypothetical protein BGP_2538 [Beggiatoa sp. PS]|nr:hypothetical protein BGP_2538 [Beggiatoa sp. PS]